jgi:hypothetical protein
MFDDLLNAKTKKIIFFSILLVVFFIGIIFFYLSSSYDEKLKNQVVTIEKVTDDFILTKASGPSPFFITVKDSNNEIYTNSFVSDLCPMYEQKALVGTKVTLTRFTNVVVASGEKRYFFKGAYEQFCTNLKFDPKSGDNYYNFN